LLIVNDTIQEKARTAEGEMMCWHYDHCSRRNVRAINLLNELYHSNGTSIPVIHQAPNVARSGCQQEMVGQINQRALP
jgi:hypothetical protein